MTSLVTYDELQAWLRLAVDDYVPLGTLRYWASTEPWTPHGTRRQRRWELEQCRATYLRIRGNPKNGTDHE